MTKDLLTDAVLRDFLLDRLDDSDREEIENLFLTDSHAKESVLNAEQDLIEDYLEDSLTDADKARFLALHAQTEEQREQIRNTKSIKDWALTERRLSEASTVSSAQDNVTVTVWPRFGARLGVKPIYLVAIAAAIVVAIVLAMVFVIGKIGERKHISIEQELAQLNTPTSLREAPPGMISLQLETGTVRGVEAQPEFQLRRETHTVELRLRWTQKERYSTYQAELRRVGENESYTVRHLHLENIETPQAIEVPQNNDVAHAIRLRLATHIRRRGHYTVRLTGLSSDGSPGVNQEYNFAVTR